MAFGSLTIGTKVYNSVGPGEYMLSTVGFGQPIDMIKISPGKKANAKAPTSASMTSILEQDFTLASGIVERRRCVANLQLSAYEGFTMVQLDARIALLSDLADSNMLTRLLLGES